MANLSSVKGQLTQLQIVPINSIGSGQPSDPVLLTPCALPSASQLIQVLQYGPNYLKLQWNIPLDTGVGDLSIPILNYQLEVDEGFTNGFVLVTGDSQSSTIFQHESLILGHTYTYRVRASNLMGYGAYSDSFRFIPRSVPAKPPTAPRSVEPSTNRNTIFLAFDKLWDDGGAPILNYNVYMDNGLEGAFIGPIANGPSLLTWNTAL